MARIKVRRSDGFSLNPDGTALFSGVELVEHQINEGHGGEDRFNRLVEIVGRLVERLPTDEWLEVTGSQYHLERVK